MYTFKTLQKEELLSGRTITYVSQLIGLSNPHLTNILNGKINCTKVTAYCIVKVLHKDKEIEDFFIRAS